MANPLKRSIQSGVKMNDRIGKLFGQIGTTAHPRGTVLTAYRNSRMMLKSALTEADPARAARDVTRSLRRELNNEISSVFADGLLLGQDEAMRQLSLYDVRALNNINMADQTQSALDAVMARFDAQAAAINALVMTDADTTQIVGDEDRTGVFSASEITAAAAYWVTYLIWNAFDATVIGNSAGMEFKKQAVAALDRRTTDCCLRVHGQIQPFNKPFQLTGTPRFADEMDWPGFHWYCRTSGVLYLEQFDDALTTQMRDGANFFLAERAAGRQPDRDPADAF